MARIRTIKPEFPQSETIGKLSREARLLFIQLWTICDDSGRTRAASRMLASLLYPYDDDARALIPEWLIELHKADCIRLYEVDGNTYLEIPKWLAHQKIDRPSASKFPSFDEGSAVPREPSRNVAQDQGPRTTEGTKDQGGEGTEVAVAPAHPLAEAVEIFNDAAEREGWPKVQNLSADRKRGLSAALKATGGLDGWQTALAKVAASDFLMGRTPRSEEHANWRFDFEFLLKPKRLTKIMEGSYDNKTGHRAHHSTGLSAALSGLVG